MSLSRAIWFPTLVGLLGSPAGAQQMTTTQPPGLMGQINQLFTFGDCGEPLCLNSSTNATTVHGDHFIPAAGTAEGNLIGFLTNAIGVGVSNLPISAATSGITFSFQGGVPVQTSVSAGPIFGERVQTLGHGRVLVGVNVTGVGFKAIRGVPLDNLVFSFTHQNVCRAGLVAAKPPNCPTTADNQLGSPALENDVIQVNTSIDLNLQAASLLLSYGILDRVDIGVALPLVRADLKGGSVARVIASSYPTPHFFGTTTNPALSAASAISSNATGVGDLAARLKINFGGSDRGAFGLLADARFPTGDEHNFLGSGKFSIRVLGIASARLGDFSPHLNAGYLYWSGKTYSDAFLATAGFDQLMAPWATLAVDFISQWQAGTSPVTLPPPVIFTQPVNHQVTPTDIPKRRDNLIDGSLGFKFLLRNRVILITNALFPLNDAGIRGNVTGTVGIAYGF
jgi:hypothetical protein